MNPKIKAISSATPKTLWSNSEISKLTNADPEFIKAKVGVENRYFLNKDESGTDLSLEAVTKLIKSQGLQLDEIGLLVYVTQTPDFKIPQSSAILHNKLGLDSSCASFDVSLGCSGYVYGLSITKSLMQAQGINTAILVTCDPYSKIMDKHDKNTMTIFGDAATATLLSNDGILDIGIADMGTDGSFSSSLQINSAGGNYPVLGVHNDKPQITSEIDEVRLNMKGREVFNFVVKNVPVSIEKCLDKNECSLEEVEWFALHQGSKHMLDYMSKRVGIPEEKMRRNLHQYGNTVSSTVPMLLEDLLDEGSLKNNSKVLISGFGVGLSWATNILIYNNSN